MLDLDPKTSAAVTKVIPLIKSYVSRGGSEEVVEGVLERLDSGGKFATTAKTIAKALDNMEKEYPDPKEREEKINQVFDLILPGIAKKGDTGELQAYSPDQIEFLAKNKNIEKYEAVYQDVKSGKLKTPEEINEALKPLAASRRVNKISEAQVDLAMALLPQDLKNSLKTQGGPGEWGKWGENQSSLDPPSEGWTGKNQAGLARARLIVRIGMEEGMRDMYTGRRIGFGDIDLEHTVPFGVAKRGAETGSNFGLTTRLSNRAKGDDSPEAWRQRVLNQYEMKNGKLTPEAMKKLQKEQAEVAEYNAKRESMRSARPDTVAAIFKGIDESNEKPENKSKLKNKALNALAGYTETYFQGWRANRDGQSRRIYVYRGVEIGDKVMDTAAQKIDAAQKSGDTGKVEKILDILRSGPTRINSELDKQYGPKRLDSEATNATETANTVRKEILTELENI